MPVKPIAVEQLPRDLQAKLKQQAGIKEIPTVPKRVVVLGEVLASLNGLTRRDALWALRNAIKQLEKR